MMREDWVETKLGRVCEFVGGGTPSKKEPSYWNGGIPWASIKDIKGDYLTGTRDYISEQGLKNSAANLAQPEDIIVATRINPGKPIRTKIRAAINQDLKIAKTRIDIDRNFLFYAFLNIENEIRKVSSGTTVLGVNLNNLRDFTFPLAPLPDQRAIVAKIEKIFSDLDNAIANLKTAKAKLDIYRQALLKKAFEGELTKAWREQRDLNGWQELMISQIGEIVTGNTPSKKNDEFYSSRDYNFYKPTDLDAGHNVFKSIDGLSLKGFQNGRQAPENSILVTCIGATIGKTGLIKSRGCFNQQINAIIPSNKYNAKYIYYQSIGIYFQTQIKDRASSTTLPILNKGKFSTLRMNVCSMEEQDQIVMEIESRLSVCDKLAESIDQSLEKAEALRQSILKKAFAGQLLSEAELVACRREPDWEPAHKLLERIKKNKSVDAKNATTGKSRKANKP